MVCAPASSRPSPAARGSATVNVAPWPMPALSARTLPPCSSTRCLTIARPRPSPPCARVVELSAWRKRSNTCGRNSGAMPRPVSADDDLHVRVDALQRDLNPRRAA